MMLKKSLETVYLVTNSSNSYKHIVKRWAGHSKWANIRHVKAQKDSERAKMFTRLGRQMKVAIQEGGSPDPSTNLKLAHIIEQAKRFSMPVATIQNIIKSTQKDKSQSKSYILEIKGPGGCIILCEAFTSNYNFLKQSISTILKKNNGKFSDGGAKHLFEQKGVIETEVPSNISAKDTIEIATTHAIECEADDVQIIEETERLQFVCDPLSVKKVQTGLEKLNYVITSASVEYIPRTLVTLTDSDLEQCSSLIEKLENLDDVVKLYDNIA